MFYQETIDETNLGEDHKILPLFMMNILDFISDDLNVFEIIDKKISNINDVIVKLAKKCNRLQVCHCQLCWKFTTDVIIIIITQQSKYNSCVNW